MKRLFPIIPFDHLSLTSLFSDMAVDPKGLGFSAMKCVQLHRLLGAPMAMSVRESNVCEVQTCFTAALASQAE